MSKTHTPNRIMAIVQPNICDSFSASAGDTVQFQNVPATGCKLSQDGNNPWPFNPGPPINNVLTAGTITIKSGLPATSVYRYNAECCLNAAIKTVTIK